MDYYEYLLHPQTRLYIDKLAEELLENPDGFEEVYRLMFLPDDNVAWKAAWTCEKISEKFPGRFATEKVSEIYSLSLSVKHGGLHRGCLSILLNLPLPDPLPVPFINACFEWMISPRCTIAVQALSMKMLYRICKQEPDLIPEFRLYLESINPGDYSKGVIAARNQMLRKLQSK